jgi:TolB-like protein/DNA-binding winged helix-turn-helix (wHTH) protein/Tfp pilus assembly protein PilF
MSESPSSESGLEMPHYRVGDLLIDTGRQRVTRGDEAVALPKLSYDLLIALVHAAPNLISNDALMELVWPKLVVSPETVSQRIKLLRDALGDDPRNPRYVEGLRGRGYRLIPSVKRDLPSAAGADSAAPTAAIPAESTTAATAPSPLPVPVTRQTALPPPAPGVPTRPSRTHLRWIAMAGIAAAGLIATLFSLHAVKKREPVPQKASVDVVAIQPRAIAVLPFENLSTETDNKYIAVGIAESVLNRLGTSRELIVIARSSSFALGKSAPDAREVGRKLGVGYVVEGSVQRAGKKLRVNAQLIDATHDTEMWSLSFDRTIDDVFAVQDEIAKRVAEKLATSLQAPSADYAKYGTEAYFALLKGRSLLETRKISDVEASILHFSHALELAPTFAAAMTDLGYAKLQLASLRMDFNKRAGALVPELKSLADRAIALDPADGAAYYLRAQLKPDTTQGKTDAEADYRKAFMLAPNYATGVYNYGGLLSTEGRYEEALALMDRAILLDPLAPSNHYLRGQVLRAILGHWDQAAASFQQAIAIAPDFYPAYTRLAQMRFIEGKLAEAIKLGEKSIAIEPKVGWTRERLIWFYVHLDDLAAARDVLRGFDAGFPDEPIEEALICYRTGNLERAEHVTRAASLHDPDSDQGGIAFFVATEAIIERALAQHSPSTARQFIMAIPGLKKDHGKIALVDDNWPEFVQLAGLERQAGNLGTAKDLAQGILEYVERSSKDAGPPGVNDWTRASALAILGRNDEALSSLEHMIRAGNHMRWFVTFERDPNFAALRATPRFQTMAAGTKTWLAGQQQLVQQMRQRGEIPPRTAQAAPGGC